ncbi:MAG TPA: hypothetical protein VLT45_03755 [Kofleriaceae bacterium]|nr:hypothetical protein [Kofleriaceae bacterium]
MTDANRRLETELARLGDEHEPPVGWEARVLAATAERSRRRWWLLAIPAIALSAAIVLLLSWPRHPAPERLALAISLDRGGPVVRGTSAQVGDVLRATARGGAYRAVWIYRSDSQLVVACPGGAGCHSDGTALTATAKLDAVGDYSIVVLAADAALPAPHGALDQDVAAAARGGAQYQIAPISVR